MDLHKVKGNGCILYFPASIGHAELMRGGKGYLVDLDAPLEREWCKGQEYKLEPAPEAKSATPIANPMAKRLIQDELARRSSAGQPTASADDLEVARPKRKVV